MYCAPYREVPGVSPLWLAMLHGEQLLSVGSCEHLLAAGSLPWSPLRPQTALDRHVLGSATVGCNWEAGQVCTSSTCLM